MFFHICIILIKQSRSLLYFFLPFMNKYYAMLAKNVYCHIVKSGWGLVGELRTGGAPLPRRLTAFPKTDYNDDAQRPHGGRIFPLLT